jgi:hypothetical protein
MTTKNENVSSSRESSFVVDDERGKCEIRTEPAGGGHREEDE